ncbi:MAG: class I SAM-dependent methyltransferase [Acidimicrobiales bacterium]
MQSLRREPPIPVSHRLLGRDEDQYMALRDWVATVATPKSNLLDVGAGDGDDHYASLIRPLVARMVGVDPSASGGTNPALDEAHAETVESFAAHNAGRFDVGLAVYVAEHVAEPEAFLRACRSCLEPGGSLFVLTPNLWHYFGLAARAVTALGIDDQLLRLLRAKRPGHDHVAHFAVSYRMNTASALARQGAAAGFASLEIAHLENPSVFETYFPGRLALLPQAYAYVVHGLGRGGAFGTLLCRLVNAAG